jgi:hypothetical protein
MVYNTLKHVREIWQKKKYVYVLYILCAFGWRIEEVIGGQNAWNG